MDPALRTQLVPGARVRVTQQIAARNNAWRTPVEGEVVAYEQKQTGSWYAHSRDGRLWLDRLVIRKSSGEMSTLNLDEFSRVEVLAAPAVDAGAAGNEAELPV